MSIDAWKPKDFSGETELLMHYHPNNLGNSQIPAPYHDSPEAVVPIIKGIEEASEGLLAYIRKKYPVN